VRLAGAIAFACALILPAGAPTRVDAQTTLYRYDALGRLIQARDTDGKTVVYKYDPAGNRVALGNGATASELMPTAFTASSSAGGFAAAPILAGMHDGLYNTVASAHVTQSQALAWIQADLGAAQSVDHVDLGAPDAAIASAATGLLNGARVEYSLNAADWKLAATVSGAIPGTYRSINLGGVQARYVRVLKTSAAVGVGEFRLFNVAAGANNPPLAVNDRYEGLSANAGLITLRPLQNDSDEDGDTLRITAAAPPTGAAVHGSIVVATDGLSIAYTPEPNFVGTYSFNYIVSDGRSVNETASATITLVYGGSGGLIAVDDGSPSSPIQIPFNATDLTSPDLFLLTNDSNPQGGPLSFYGRGQGAHGRTRAGLAANSTRYIPAKGYFGPDAFTYTIADEQGHLSTATVYVNVPDPGPNRAPTPGLDTYVVPMNTATIMRVRDNDTDPDNDDVFVMEPSQPAHGTARTNGDAATLIYTPTPGYSGPDGFSYPLVDSRGGRATGIVSISIPGPGNPNGDFGPVAVDDLYSVVNSGEMALSVLANDMDADGDPLTIIAKTSAAKGLTRIDSANRIFYLPDPGFEGEDRLTYTISDGRGGTSTATVKLNVTTASAVNHPPVAVDDGSPTNPIQIPFGATYVFTTIDVTGNDSDPDGDPVVPIAASSGAAHGAVLLGNDQLRYAPYPDYSGPDNFPYGASDRRGGVSNARVYVNVAQAPNRAPRPADDSYAVVYNTPLSLSVKANDLEPDGQAMTLVSTTMPSHGQVSIVGGATITYTPTNGYVGNDTFSYAVSDPTGLTATATVNLTVASNAFIDYVVVGGGGGAGALAQAAPGAGGAGGYIEKTPQPTTPGSYPVAVGSGGARAANGGNTTFKGLTAIGGGAGGRAGSSSLGLGYDAGSGAAGGSGGGGGEITGAVGAGGAGTSGQGNAGQDGQEGDGGGNGGGAGASGAAGGAGIASSITGTSVTRAKGGSGNGSAASIASSGNGADGRSSPGAGATGVVIVRYLTGSLTGTGGTITTAGGYTIHTFTANGTFVIGPVGGNHAPTATNDTASAAYNTATAVKVLANDGDPDGDSLTVTTASTPAHGQVAVVGDASITYTPASGYVGPDSFTYAISDGRGATATGTVAVTVLARANKTPTLANDTAVVLHNTATSLNVRANDSDPDGDTLTLTTASTPAHGQVQVVGGATITYTPTNGYSGADSFNYVVSDGFGGSATATVSITVRGPNQSPTAANDAVVALWDTTTSLTVLANDTDPENDPLILSAVSTPTHGSVTIVGGKTLAYTPAGDFTADSFTYTVSDGAGGSATATVAVTIREGVKIEALMVGGGGGGGGRVSAPGGGGGGGRVLPVASIVIEAGSAPIVVGGGGLRGSLSYPAENGGQTSAFGYIAPGGGAGGGDGGAAVKGGAGGSGGGGLGPLSGGAAIASGGGYGNAGGTGTGDGGSAPGGGGGATAPGGGASPTVAGSGGAGFNSSISGTSEVYGSGGGGGRTDAIGGGAAGVNAGAGQRARGQDGRANFGGGGGGGGDFEGARNAGGNGGAGVVILRYLTGRASITGGTITTSGPYTIHTFKASDTINVSTVAPNRAPVAANDSVSVARNQVASLKTLRSNDTDADGDVLSIVAVGAPAHGTAVIADGGASVSYTPTADYNGADSFTYTVSDGRHLTATATVSVNVVEGAFVDYLVVGGGGGGGWSIGGGGGAGGVLTAKGWQLVQGSYAVTVGAGGAGSLADVEGDDYSNVLSKPGGNSSVGTLIARGGGGGGSSSPSPSYAGQDGASGGGAAGGGDYPTTTAGQGLAGQGRNGGLADNGGGGGGGGYQGAGANGGGFPRGAGGGGLDSDITGVMTNYAAGGGGGSSIANTDGATTIPAGGASGGAGGARVAGSNAAVNRGGGGGGGGARSFFSSNTSYNGGAGGSGVVVIRYLTGAANLTGGTITTSGAYKIHTFTTSGTLTVQSVTPNHGPTAVNDALTAGYSAATSLAVRSNDTDPDGDPLTISAVSAPSHGVASIASDGLTVLYTPVTGYFGADSLTYTINDGRGGYATAIVTLTVPQEVNAAIEYLVVGAATAGESGHEIGRGGGGGQVVSGSANLQSGNLAVTIGAPAAHGATAGSSSLVGIATALGAKPYGVSGSGFAAGTTNWPPGGGGGAGGAGGNAVNIDDNNAISGQPGVGVSSSISGVAVIYGAGGPGGRGSGANEDGSDWDIEGGTPVVNGGTQAFPPTSPAPNTGIGGIGGTKTPSTNYSGAAGSNGVVIVRYQKGPAVLAGGVITTSGNYIIHTFTTSGTLSVQANKAPTAVNDTTVAYGGFAALLPVLVNDTDPDNDALTISAVGTPAHGTVSISGGTSLNYTPTSGYIGSDSFTYTAADGRGGTATATITVDVQLGHAVDYLIVGGGGSGGRANSGSGAGGGGGGGGAVYFANGVALGAGSFAITIGQGGVADTAGATTSLGSIVSADGGGRGGGWALDATTPGSGSGGGGTQGRLPATPSIAGHGRAGGTGHYAGGGGGGYSAIGANYTNASVQTAGVGGAGYTSSISGASVVYGSGGGGGGFLDSNGWVASPASGGSGAGSGDSYTGGAGLANRGGGGGGGSFRRSPENNGAYGGAGGSGVIIVRYPTGSMTATGGAVTTSGGYTIHTFTSNGSFTVQ
jgi:YD repeat-containing protein